MGRPIGLFALGFETLYCETEYRSWGGFVMGTKDMGKVEVTACLENQFDLSRVKAGMLTPEEVRRVEVQQALVDTGTTGLSAPKNLIEQLGLFPHGLRRLRTANGYVERMNYGGVRLTIQDRDVLCDITELPDDYPVLIGQIPLEAMDFVVDPVGRRLIGNPEHGGAWVQEMF
jgi:predicted aspartyl protease